MKILYLLILFHLLSTCTIQLGASNEKAAKKCSECKEFLKETKIYEATYREYDKSNFQGDVIPLVENSDSLKTRYKTSFIDSEDVNYLDAHTFCFIGMKKANVEKRFGSSLNMITAPSINSITKKDEWFTWYSFKVGSQDKNGNVYVGIGGGFGFNYEFVGSDTLYRASIIDIERLKECLDAKGIKYSD